MPCGPVKNLGGPNQNKGLSYWNFSWKNMHCTRLRWLQPKENQNDGALYQLTGAWPRRFERTNKLVKSRMVLLLPIRHMHVTCTIRAFSQQLPPHSIHGDNRCRCRVAPDLEPGQYLPSFCLFKATLRYHGQAHQIKGRLS